MNAPQRLALFDCRDQAIDQAVEAWIAGDLEAAHNHAYRAWRYDQILRELIA